MTYRCQYCSGLSVQGLVRLAKQEFTGHWFPTSAYYQHHGSLHDLEESAHAGCDLCLLILNCLKGMPWTEGKRMTHSYFTWEQADLSIYESAYTVAKELDVSDVKLCISTDHVYNGETLEKVRAFTTLLVQIGPPEVPEPSEYFEFPYLTLSLNAQDGVECLTEFEGFKIGRLKVHPDLGSPTQFKIASRWLHECRTSHQACLMSRIPELPTRVVDIGSPDNAVHPRLFVSKGKKADYIALSHCWGGSIDPVLTQGTYEDFQKELPVSKLAANFKDAIRIARELGIQYVWIDCLCIIQDSKEDWEIESSKMGAIYRNATLTVSALVSARSTVGILKSPENNFIGAPETAKLRMYEDSSKDGEVDVEWKSREEENLRVLMMNSALASRGWTLQEYILSPRNLLYGGRQIYWRCPSRMISADDTPEGNQFPSEVQFPNASKIIYSDILAMKPQIKADVKAVLEDYYALVQTYSARQLTFGSDKFAAFSGIAQLMHPAIGAQYIAGIWTRDFKHGLLWYKELGSCRHVESHGAPSWSWMVTDSNVLFSTRLLEATPYDVKILRYNDIPQDPTMQFGRIKSAFVVVEGLTTPLIRSKQIVHALNRDDIMLGSVFYDEPSFPDERGMLNSVIFVDDEAHGPSLVSVNAEFGNDDFNVDSAHYVEENLLILLVQADGSDEDDDMDENFGEGLILRPLKHGSEHAYERIGYVSFSGLCMAFFQGWESRKLKMI